MRSHTFGSKPITAGVGAELAIADIFAREAAPRAATPVSMRLVFAWCSGRLERWRHRAQLAELTDEQLFDIGLSREARDREVARSIWE